MADEDTQNERTSIPLISKDYRLFGTLGSLVILQFYPCKMKKFHSKHAIVVRGCQSVNIA